MNKKSNKGIALTALVVIIIAILIIGAVVIGIAVKGGLFNKDKEVGADMGIIDKYISGETSKETEETSKERENDKEKFSAIYKETKMYTDENGETAPIPKGFSVGTSEEINKISTGLVIRDKDGNEFVWIPVEGDLSTLYSSKSGYSEPKEITDTYYGSSAACDSQTTLTYLYGDKFNYEEDFDYATEYAEMVAQVNKYDGFYIGRYETTIDENGKIGSKYNTKVLTAGDQFTYNGTSYYYRWYGLYYFQKNANVTGNKEDVQTAMIYGQLWDKAMEFIRTNDTNYNVDSYTSAWHGSSNGHTGVVNSGQANKITAGVNGAIGDVALNIWDLEANAWEWTQEAYSTYNRVIRGGYYNYSVYASLRDFSTPTYFSTGLSSRLALYIK